MKRLSIIVFIFVMAVAAWAVPARKTGIVMTQPDGSQITIYQHGDEHFHWQTNEKGEWLKLDENGFYRVTEALSADQIKAKQMASPKRAEYRATPINLAPRGLVILVNFADAAFETDKAVIDSMLTAVDFAREYSYTYRGQTYNVSSQGSARKYFEDVSCGQYNPQFDVVGPVKISNNYSYYGKNNRAGQDSYPEEMIEEACKLADTECDIDFSQYDNNNDGYVDFVFVIYAGFGEADGGASNAIWPHAWYLYTAAGRRCQLDGKIVDLYACGNELDFYSKQHTGIGTFCHEFSHVLGLPDLYVTADALNHTTLNEWDIMDYGPYNNESNTPPAYSAYERFFMGWLQPRLIVDPENVVLNDLKESNEALLISTTDVHNLIGNDPSPTTFYMIENRQQTGWDEYLPGHGMMLTKIQYSYNRWYDNTVNNTSNKLGVDMIEASGKTSSLGKTTDLFPAGASQYLGIEDHSIEAIDEVDGVITFKYRGGIEDPETAVDHIASEPDIIAIYNILGQKQTTTNIEELTRGTYIIMTASSSKKIVR